MMIARRVDVRRERPNQRFEAAGARRLRNESFFSAPQLKRDPLGSDMTEQELSDIESRVRAATPGPWQSFIEDRDHESGSNFIKTQGKDIELLGATDADQDFIAHARQDVPRLVEELRRLRREHTAK
jgi:hypothetical protein